MNDSVAGALFKKISLSETASFWVDGGLDRDWNAAKNILSRELSTVGHPEPGFIGSPWGNFPAPGLNFFVSGKRVWAIKIPLAFRQGSVKQADKMHREMVLNSLALTNY